MTAPQAMVKQCLSSASRVLKAIKQNNTIRKSRESYSLLSTLTYVRLTSNSFFGTFFVEKQSAVRHGGA